MDIWRGLEVIMMSLAGGIVRYLTDFLIRAEAQVEDISLKLLIIHAIVGTFAGFLSYLVVGLFTTSYLVGLVAAGVGSFGSYGTLFWLLKQAKKKFVVMDESVYSRYKDLRDSGYFKDTDNELDGRNSG